MKTRKQILAEIEALKTLAHHNPGEASIVGQINVLTWVLMN